MKKKQIENNLNEAITCLSLVEKNIENNNIQNDIRRIINEIEEILEEYKK